MTTDMDIETEFSARATGHRAGHDHRSPMQGELMVVTDSSPDVRPVLHPSGPDIHQGVVHEAGPHVVGEDDSGARDLQGTAADHAVGQILHHRRHGLERSRALVGE